MALGWAARLAIVWCLLALLGDVLSQAQAQESTTSGDESGVIQEIRVEGNQRIEAATIRSYMTVAPGEPFDPAKLDQSLKNLFATGLFDDVSIRREGNDLVVTLVENPIINRIAFEGNLRLDDEVLTSEVQLRPRVVYTRSRVQNAVGRILELYRRNGRYGATVEPKVIHLPQNRVDLVFEINEGPLTEIERIVFIGNQAFDDGDLRGVIQTKESAWYRILSSDDTYDPDRLAFDQELLRRFYLSRGYADFNVRSAIAELTPDGKSFVITFTVDEGEPYDFGEIAIEFASARSGARAAARAAQDRDRRHLQCRSGRGLDRRPDRGDRRARLRFRRDQSGPDQGRSESHHRSDLRHQRGLAGLRRADRHHRQCAHPRRGHPARVPARRRRRLQHRPAAALTPAHPGPRLLRDGRPQDAAGLEPRQDQDRGRGRRAVHRRAVVRCGLLDLGRTARRHPPERAQPARARPVSDGVVPDLGPHPGDRPQLHRAILPGPGPCRRRRPVPARRPTSRARARSTRPPPAAPCARPTR